MLVITTMFIAVIVLALLWYLLLKRIRWPWLNYLIVVVVSIGFLCLGSVHFIYIGLGKL